MQALHAFARQRRLLALALALVLGAALLVPGRAHAEFPDGKPVKIVVGFGPGTGSDLQARALADVLARELGTAVIIDNRPGAAGMVATASVVSAPPDGHTLVFGTTTSLLTLPLLSANVKYDAVRDFTPIATLAKAPFLLMVPNKPGAPASVKELLARAKVGSLNYGSIGNGSFGHLATVRLLQAAGKLQATHVPYKSSPQELQELAAGGLDFAIDSSTAGLPLVQNGLLRALAVTSATRLASLPDVPTVAEALGMPFEHTVWTGLLAPAHTPAPVVHKLAEAITRALATKELQARNAAMELQPFELDSAAFTAYLKTEMPAWRDFLARNQIHID
jgi:tripartite-type tricarboxylate transporter receptor subunit TctC